MTAKEMMKESRGVRVSEKKEINKLNTLFLRGSRVILMSEKEWLQVKFSTVIRFLEEGKTEKEKVLNL